jgi:hypothetical protein
MDGQLRFDGREIAQIKSRWGDLEFDSLPDGLTREQLAGLSIGDEATCTIRFKVEDVGHGEKLDRQGVGTKPLTRTVRLKTLSTAFHVDAVAKREDIEAAWQAAAQKGA